MASGAAGERLMDKFNFIPGTDHGEGGTITRPGLGQSTMESLPGSVRESVHWCQQGVRAVWEIHALSSPITRAKSWRLCTQVSRQRICGVEYNGESLTAFVDWLPCFATREYNGEYMTAIVDWKCRIFQCLGSR